MVLHIGNQRQAARASTAPMVMLKSVAWVSNPVKHAKVHMFKRWFSNVMTPMHLARSHSGNHRKYCCPSFLPLPHPSPSHKKCWYQQKVAANQQGEYPGGGSAWVAVWDSSHFPWGKKVDVMILLSRGGGKILWYFFFCHSRMLRQPPQSGLKPGSPYLAFE